MEVGTYTSGIAVNISSSSSCSCSCRSLCLSVSSSASEAFVVDISTGGSQEEMRRWEAARARVARVKIAGVVVGEGEVGIFGGWDGGEGRGGRRWWGGDGGF